MIQGSPIPTKLPEDLHIGDRFWRWRGASGRNYIHSVYAADAVPPLPGAVYVAVRHEKGERHAIAVGRFPSFWDSAMSVEIADLDADEIHVHLLARDHAAAQVILNDLQEAMPRAWDYQPGFNPQDQPVLCAA